MPDIPAALGRKYGPLPGYAWLAIAGVGTYVIIKRRGSSGTASSSAGSSSQGEGGGGSTDTGSAGGADTSAGGVDPAAYGAGYSDGIGSGYDLAQSTLGPTDAGLAAIERDEQTQTGILRKILKRTAAHPAKAKTKRPPHAAHHGQPTRHPHPAKAHHPAHHAANPRKPHPPTPRQRAAPPHHATRPRARR